MTTSYTSVFGGGVISPVLESYINYVLTAPIVLVWPQETQPNSVLAAQIIDVDVTSTGSYSLTLPPASQVSVGQFVIINNKSAFNQAIFNASGQIIIAALAPGAIYFIYLTNNSNSAGVWSAFQYGAQASAPSASALAGAGLLATGSTLSQDIVVTSLNAPYSVGVPDRAKLLNWTGGSGTITLPLAATAQPSFYIQLRNSGSSILTTATSGSDVINTASTISLNPGDSCFVVTDGTAWFTLGLGPILTASFGFIVINVPSVIVGAIVTLSGTQLNQIAYRFTGALTANTIVDLPAVKQQYWVDNQTSGAFLLTFQVPTVAGGPTPAGATVAVPQGSRIILYTDGTNVLNASTGGISIPVAVNQGGTAATTPGGALINLGGTTTGIGVFTAAGPVNVQAAIAAPSTADAYIFALVL